MTIDLDFRAMLDADPTHWQTYLVYADFLKEREDVRADGFHALGANRLVPWWFSASHSWGFLLLDYVTSHRWGKDGPLAQHCLPHDWFALVQSSRGHVAKSSYEVSTPIYKPKNHNGFILLRAVALAFSRLPDARRAELIAGGAA